MTQLDSFTKLQITGDMLGFSIPQVMDSFKKVEVKPNIVDTALPSSHIGGVRQPLIIIYRTAGGEAAALTGAKHSYGMLIGHPEIVQSTDGNNRLIMKARVVSDAAEAEAFLKAEIAQAEQLKKHAAENHGQDIPVDRAVQWIANGGRLEITNPELDNGQLTVRVETNVKQEPILPATLRTVAGDVAAEAVIDRDSRTLNATRVAQTSANNVTYQFLPAQFIIEQCEQSGSKISNAGMSQKLWNAAYGFPGTSASVILAGMAEMMLIASIRGRGKGK